MRIAAVDALSDQGFFDKYALFAQQILDGRWPIHRIGDLSPGYLWSMVVAFGPVGGDYLDVRAIQIAAVSAVALLCAWTSFKLWGGIAGIVAAVAVLSSRAALLNATDLEPETLVLLLNTIALSLLVVGRNRWTESLAGFVFGLSAVCRPTALAVAGAILLVLWWRRGASLRDLRLPGTCSAKSNGCFSGVVWSLFRRIFDPYHQYEPANSPDKDLKRPAKLRRSFSRYRLLAPTFPLGFAVALVVPVLILKILYSTIPGAGTLMNPGTVFYEGMNPLTTGLAGDAPAVVKAVESTINEPDALHEAYRLVASRSLDGQGGERASNRFWWQKSRAFMSEEPAAAMRIFGRKMILAVSSHDAWDLRTTVRKQDELNSPLWIPFGLLLSLALLGVVVCRSDITLPIFWVYTDAYLLIMLVFYVTARQRNPVLPVLAMLAGAAVQRLLGMWREGGRRQVLISVAAVMAATLLFGIDGRAQMEDQHTWKSLLSERADFTNADRFDEALGYMTDGQWLLAENILARIDGVGYRPLRGAMATSSVAYQRARCLLHLDRRAMVPELIARASREAPGDPFVLALAMESAKRKADGHELRDLNHRLSSMYDRFTAGFAMARAQADFGAFEESRFTLGPLVETLPEWSEPVEMLRLIPKSRIFVEQPP